ncbi:MAG: TonB-dependent receptor [Variibacter sp.]|nr:TonB-dependent receptor [Variibacter sp.]
MQRPWVAVVIGGVIWGSGGADARAQTTLPEVVVTAPSPKPQARAPRRRTAARPQPFPAAAAPAPAAPAPPAAAGPVAPATGLSSPEIARAPGATVGDLLGSQPGVAASTFAAGASRPILRGLDNARVRVQENGIGAMDASALSEDHAVPIDPLTADRVEVIRGPATLRWGPGATGGVVAVTNNRIPDPTTPQGVDLVTRSAVGTVDRAIESAVIVDARAADAAVHADYARRRAGDYAIPGGVQANTALDTQSMAVGASRFFQNGYVGFALTHLDSLYGIPGIEDAAARTRIDLHQTKLVGKGEFRLDNSLVDTIRFWLGGTLYRHDERGFDAGIDTVHATFRNKEVEGRTELQFVPVATALGRFTSTLGVQAGYQSLGTSGDAGTLLAPAQTTRLGAYSFNELGLTRSTRLQAAGRIGVIGVNGTAATFPAGFLPNGTPVPENARSRHFAPMSASVGLFQDLPFGLVASLTGQIVQRAPEAQELFSKGAHDASGTFEIGNERLAVETAASVEFGLRRTQGRLRFAFNAFHTHYSGFIFNRLTGNTCDDEFASCVAGPGGMLKQVVFDQRDARFTGAEFKAQFDLATVAAGTLGLDGQYDLVRARFADGTSVPRIPPQRLGGGLYWRDANWFARVGLLHAFAQNEIAPQETATAGYNLLTAELAYNRKFKSTDVLKELTVGVVGTNLLDDDVRNHVSFKKDEVLQPGRGARFFATLRF